MVYLKAIFKRSTIVALVPIIILTIKDYNLKAQEIKYTIQEKTIIQPLDIRWLSGEKLTGLCRNILMNEQLKRSFDAALFDRAKTIPTKDTARTYFSIGSTLEHLSSEINISSEEKEIADKLAAHYYVNSLILGDCSARVLLIYCYPPAKHLMSAVDTNPKKVDQAFFNLLVSITYDYLIKNKKYMVKNKNS